MAPEAVGPRAPGSDIHLWRCGVIGRRRSADLHSLCSVQASTSGLPSHRSNDSRCRRLDYCPSCDSCYHIDTPKEVNEVFDAESS